jgi:uncharacterized membrane protein
MPRNTVQQVLLKVSSIFVMIGGLVRLLANQQTFQSFAIGELWAFHPYFTYVYKILGAFVVYAGITMFIIARDPVRYTTILKAWGFCFLFVSMVMLVAGYTLHMSFAHYGVDVIFCLFISVVCFSLGYRRAGPGQRFGDQI